MKNKLIGSLALGSIVGLASAAANAAENPFAVKDLGHGYQLASADKDAEGKCGEGKCGAKKETKDHEAKCGEGVCGGAKDADKESKKSKDMEGKCGEGKCGGSA